MDELKKKLKRLIIWNGGSSILLSPGTTWHGMECWCFKLASCLIPPPICGRPFRMKHACPNKGPHIRILHFS